MRNLLSLYSDKITGSISGWDRIRFRGTIRWLASTRGIQSYVSKQNILLKNFGRWAQSVTQKIRSSCEAQATVLDIPFLYLNSSKTDKEALAREIASERGVEFGDICMFSVVEVCWAPTVKGDRRDKKLHIEIAPRKCIFIYHYWNDPVFGFGHTRLQTWVPLSATICINGRHWLEHQLLQEGIDYSKDGNCFPYIADMQRAQELLDDQLKMHWPPILESLLERNCPVVLNAFNDFPFEYYWSADETEWATDISFRSTEELDAIYPSLLRYGMVSAQSPAVMRFFGKKMKGNVAMSASAPKEIISDLRCRYEGVRIKHWINKNSVKMYNKAGNLLRIETTINDPREFKVFRHPNDDTSKPASWQKMRKGVSDLHRRSQVSDACNKRYSEHLAAASVTEPLTQCVGEICRRVKKNGRPHRAINPWSYDDHRMLSFLAKGENHINGFRNRDLREALYPEVDENNLDEKRRASGRVTRRLQLLRAHGLIKKVPRTTRYQLTAKGRKVTNAICAASAADIQKLMDLAA